MKITKEEIVKLIKEELESALNEEYTYDILGKRQSGPKSHIIKAPLGQGHLVIPRSGGNNPPSDLERKMGELFGGMKGFVKALNAGDERALRIFNQLKENAE